MRRHHIKPVIQHSRCRARAFLVALVIGLASDAAKAAVTILGAQYQPDQYFPEFDCYWNASAYPGPCRTPIQGATLHVYVKNTGTTAVTNTDVALTTSSATYSLTRVIKMSGASWNPKQQTSIYFYWDNPPSDVMAAGEPVWYRFDPPTIAAGKVGQVAVRMRYLPTTPTLTLSVVSTAGTVTTNITVDPNVPRVASIGYSDDLKKVYLHWRRSGGAAPTSVSLDGTNVTASTTSVGDPSVNFGVSVVSLANALPFFSYHVFQGVYADGKIAAASQRAWTNKFIYATYSAFDDYTGAEWVAEASDHGFNNVQMNLGIMGNYLGTVSGRADCVAHGYGYTIGDKSKLNALDPDMWFLNDEPDAQENNQSNTHCGTGYKIPCDSDHWVGTLVITNVNIYGQTGLRKARPNVPFTVNLDGGLEPESFFTWGPAVDILQTDNYYDVRLKDSYLSYPSRIPLFNNARFSYAVARTACAGAEPNPSNHLLYSNKDNETGWPYPAPQSKRFEAYYSLAGGSKGIGYWWFNPPEGLNSSAECAPLWKEMGLVGNEIKTARPLLVISTPVDLTLTPSTTNVWARPLASGNNTLILLVVNNKYTNDITGCHYTAVPNATVTATLPSWMLASPTAFEITAGGLWDVSTVLNGSQLQVNLGTLTLTKMIVVTTDPTLRSTIQTRYDTLVKPHVCNFAQELCANTPPTIAQQPANQTVAPGGTAHFTVVTGGTSPLSYRWQKNNVNLSDGGHYSGSTTITLTISSADTNNDAAAYRCVVSNPYGTVTSSSGTLTVTNQPPEITQQPTDDTVLAGGTVSFIVVASGSEPLAYQWQKNNVNLSDGGHYLGSTTAALTITNADNNDEASYRCVVSNVCGSTDSDAARLTINWCVPSILLGHGDMEDASSYSVCPDWESYSAGNGVASWAKESTTIHGGVASQKCRNSNGGAGSVLGVRQTFDANVGDAFTFEGWVNPVSNPGAGQQVALVVRWDGSTANPTTNGGSWKISTGLRTVWTHLQNLSGNATNTEVTLFLDSRRTASSQDLTAYWDDVVVYRAYVPLAPLVSGASSTSLNVKVTPDCNSANTAAQFAMSISGGAYTLGTHWVQANGTVGAAMVWQSAAMWGTRKVTGLATGTPYTFKVQARYSSTYTQPTSLGAGATLAPLATQAPQLTVQRNGNALTLTWPESPSARLEQAGSLTPPASWVTTTNQATIVGGQKSVTLTPTGSAGYYRLVLE